MEEDMIVVLCPYCNSSNIELVEYVTEHIMEYDCIKCYKSFFAEEILEIVDIKVRKTRYSK